jgi:hypothetical protein
MVGHHRFAPMLMILGWLVLLQAGWADEADAIRTVEKLGGKVSVDDKRPGKPVVSVTFNGDNKSIDAALKVLGEFKHLEILMVLNNLDITEAGMKEIGKAKNLKTLGMGGSKFSDMNFKHIKDLSSLERLDIGVSQVTDAGLKELKNFKGLKSLSLVVARNITNAGLVELKAIQSLEYLDLRGTPITDDGLTHLKDLKNLRELFLEGTKVTDAGVKSLQAASPKLRINR